MADIGAADANTMGKTNMVRPMAAPMSPFRLPSVEYVFAGKGHAHIVKNTGSRLKKRLLLKGIS